MNAIIIAPVLENTQQMLHVFFVFYFNQPVLAIKLFLL